MKHASSVPIDVEAQRYLKHYALLESARRGAHLHLNQIWLQLNRLITRELSGVLSKDNWVELISPEADQFIGLRWTTLSLGGGVTIEVADVRRWTSVSGDRVIFTLSAQDRTLRQTLRARLDDQTLSQTLNLGNQLSDSLLRYGTESSRIISVAVGLGTQNPRDEAGSILSWIALLWDLVEELTSQVTTPPLARSSGDDVVEARPPSSKAPRFASAAPPIDQEMREQSPFPPTLPPEDRRSVAEEVTRQLRETDFTSKQARSQSEEYDPLDHMTKEEMIQAVQAQVRQRPGRLIRGGDRNTAPAPDNPPRYVPRALSDREEREATLTQDRSRSDYSDNGETGQVYPPSMPVEEISLSADAPRVIATEPMTQVIGDHDSAPHSMTQDDEVKAPSYIKPLSQTTTSVDESATNDSVPEPELHQEAQPADGALNNDPSNEVNIDDLTLLLERIGLPPWRINTYDEGKGQILWLKNGSHLDYNPAGEVILGGENQDETRARLSQVGFTL